MNPPKTGKSSVGEVFSSTARAFKNHPAIFVPFLVFSVIESLALIAVSLSPRVPLVSVLGPIIRTLWEERFLHYPANFLLLPKLVSLSRMGLAIIFSSLLTGVVIIMIQNIYNQKAAQLGKTFFIALKKYISLFVIVLILYGLFYSLGKLLSNGLMKYFLAGHQKLLFWGPDVWLGWVLVVLNFILALFIQAAFIYAIPALIIENEKVIKSIIKSFGLFIKFFIPTIILVCLPMLIYLPVVVLIYNTAFLMDRFYPEIILYISFLSIVVSSLIVDPIVTTATTLFYLGRREAQRAT